MYPNDDFIPLTLTIIIKTFKKMVRAEILIKSVHDLDRMQFVYRLNRGVEDVVVIIKCAL